MGNSKLFMAARSPGGGLWGKGVWSGWEVGRGALPYFLSDALGPLLYIWTQDPSKMERLAESFPGPIAVPNLFLLAKLRSALKTRNKISTFTNCYRQRAV